MEQTVSSYFCIFCEKLDLESTTEAYDHYKAHTSRLYYCPECDRDQSCAKDHSNEMTASSGPESEDGLIEMWIERFLAFQSEIIGKTYGDFFRVTKLFSGCIVCETFLKLCTENEIPLNNKHIQWSANQSVSNEGRHMCSHLRYYPYECLKCEKAGKYHKKCDISEITRHIRGSHSMSVKNPNFETCIKEVKIRKLESLIETTLVNKTAAKPFTPVTKNRPPPEPISPVRSSKRIINQTPKAAAIASEPVAKRPKVETKMIVIKNDSNGRNGDNDQSPTYSANTSFGQKNGTMTIKMNIRKQNPLLQTIASPPKTIINRIKATKNLQNSPSVRSEIVFKPVTKTYSNPAVNQQIRVNKQNNLISGDQIIIKTVGERAKTATTGPKAVSIIKKNTSPLVKKSPPVNLSQHFSDLMADEGQDTKNLEATVNNLVQNLTYFCIFCSETTTDKDEAFRHIQRHVEYLPIICMTCGEGLTDIQSFMKHHRKLHPNAVKGKYKKKEQPLLEKWISSFLYSQATIIRSFPPREACPVCDVLFTRAEVQRMKPRRCTVNRRIDHLYRHMSYLPYECVLCRESGQEFLVAYFESKAHSHIKLKHPQIDDTEERWQVFQKTISIPKLDEFIENYLTSYGISMTFERRPVKKNKFGGSQSPPEPKPKSTSHKFSDRSLNLNMIFSDIMETKPEKRVNKEEVKEGEIDEEDEDEELDGLDEFDEEEDDPTLLKEEPSTLNESTNTSTDTNMVVNVSPLNLFGKSISDDNEEEELYFCVFCSKNKYFTKMEAYAHYGSHLDYNPVLCKICSQKFADVDHLMAHHQSAHSSRANVDYEIREDQILVKWVNEFLESQKSIKKVMPCSCSYNCPVCLKLIGSELSDMSMPCTQHNDVVFSVHIHKHLNYFPYECLACKKNNKSVRVPNLDAMAMSHLKEHNNANASMSQVVRSFPKTLVISQLEKLIGDSVNRKRMSEKKTRFESVNGFSPTIVNNNNLQLNNISLPDGQPSTSKSPAKTQHIRLQGSRIINLPPNARLMAARAAIGSAVDQSKRVRCMHCQQSFADKNILRAHHMQAHPGKPILCTKSM